MPHCDRAPTRNAAPPTAEKQHHLHPWCHAVESSGPGSIARSAGEQQQDQQEQQLQHQHQQHQHHRHHPTPPPTAIKRKQSGTKRRLHEHHHPLPTSLIPQKVPARHLLPPPTPTSKSMYAFHRVSGMSSTGWRIASSNTARDLSVSPTDPSSAANWAQAPQSLGNASKDLLRHVYIRSKRGHAHIFFAYAVSGPSVAIIGHKTLSSYVRISSYQYTRTPIFLFFR